MATITPISAPDKVPELSSEAVSRSPAKVTAFVEAPVIVPLFDRLAAWPAFAPWDCNWIPCIPPVIWPLFSIEPPPERMMPKRSPAIDPFASLMTLAL